MNNWKELFAKIETSDFQANVFKIIGNEWMLLTAGNGKTFNTMTASWGGLGVLWHKPIAICFIRPTRHTYEFANNFDVITYSFFKEEHRSILQFCGSRSGKNVDKIKETGLIPVETENGGITYKQTRLCIETRTIYAEDFKPEKLPTGIDESIYPSKDYHRMYIGEILGIYQNIQ